MRNARYNTLFLYSGVFSFLLGVCVRSFIYIPFFVSLGVIVFAFIFLFVFHSRHVQLAVLISVSILASALGILRFDYQQLRNADVFSVIQTGETSIFSVRVVSDPEYQSSRQRFVVETLEGETYKILVSSDRYPSVVFGDVLTLQGKLRFPENFETDTGRNFDYISYLAKDEIYVTMSFARILERIPPDRKGLRRSLFEFKHSFVESFERVIPHPESALLSGILLGVRASLGDELEQDFIDTGTIHIVVLSGYNVTVVSEAIVRSLQSFLPRVASIALGGVGIILFAIITGATTTTVRASIMGLLGLFARLTRRNYEISRILLLAAFVMVLHNPFVLVFDISFQLSFLATLGLIWISPLIEEWNISKRMSQRFGIRQIFASTLATQIAVLPYLMYRIGALSIISPVVNMLVLPIIPFAMGVGALVGFIEMIVSLGSSPVSWISFLSLHYVIVIVEFFAQFSFSSISVPHIPLFMVFMTYIFMIYIVQKRYRNPRFQIKLIQK